MSVQGRKAAPPAETQATPKLHPAGAGTAPQDVCFSPGLQGEREMGLLLDLTRGLTTTAVTPVQTLLKASRVWGESA